MKILSDFSSDVNQKQNSKQRDSKQNNKQIKSKDSYTLIFTKT